MSNIITLHQYTKLDIDPDKVLNGAIGKLDEVLILGHCHDGNSWFASNTSDGGQLLWLIEKFKHKLLSGDFGKDD